MRILLLLFLLFNFIQAIRAQDTSPRQIIINNVHIFDGIHENLIHGNLLIIGNKIARVRTRPIATEKEKPVTVIDGRGLYLIPGLIDAHTHATFEDVSVPISRVATDVDWGTLNIIATQAAKRQLLRGFTTIRNMGGNAIPLARAIDNGIVSGPRIYPSGAFISQSGGHGDFGALTDVPRTRDDLSYAERIGFTAIADGADQVTRRAREQFRLGATQIKLMAGGGISSNYDPIDVSQYTGEEFRAAVNAAENWGSYVAVHAYTPRAIQTAIRAGVKSIEHGHLLDDETAKMMADKSVWLSIQPFGGEIKYPKGSENYKKAVLVYGQTDHAYKLAKKYGVKTAWGTDLFGGKERADEEGIRLARLKNWYSPYEILKMVTSNNAEFLRMCGPRNPYKDGRIGEISEGAYADLIIVNGNLMEDIDLVTDPAKNFLLIMKDGVIYKNILLEKK